MVFGTALLTNIINICKERDLKSLSLEVNQNNLTAIHLYKKFGFKSVGLRKNYYQNNDGILMKLYF